MPNFYGVVVDSKETLYDILGFCQKIKGNAASDVLIPTLVECARSGVINEALVTCKAHYEAHKDGTDEELGIALLEADDECQQLIRDKSNTVPA